VIKTAGQGYILLRLLKPGIGLAHGWGNEIDKKLIWRWKM
jgi:hypothetical protein